MRLRRLDPVGRFLSKAQRGGHSQAFYHPTLSDTASAWSMLTEGTFEEAGSHYE